ncbi:MAG: hypothetical protein PHU51_00690 [Candidatus Nanoarchaeia archaeon]|nr:hypothetical protein [Candidatus Nanoarchaeia archaeon]
MYHNKDSNTILYWVIAVLLVVILGTYGYIAYDKYVETKEQEKIDLMNQGAVLGAEQAIMQLINEASKCQPFPVRYENTTVTMFALECTNLAQVASATLQARQSE